ncbi:Mucin-like spermatophore wall protein 2 [Caligus rogercresseyi]|uniref:Mucin-like spermatophore wall protein 2 n=1 Tax=Caligus rogercresseyi TaxID=217165 RepID=A0A7T8GWX7_CALRO|nr:Mucin-like spermatophore wall protein 2 [Caligus rogercresseyi]
MQISGHSLFIQWRVRPLINGDGSCEPKKNDTRQCGNDQLSPGTKWLLAEHKKCISELEHLKDIIGDLHRWVDLIHEKGQSMFNAFNELKKHLEDIQHQILGLHRVNHDNEIIINRLKKELDDWKGKARRFQVELDEVKSKYTELERQHNKMKREYAACSSEHEQCSTQQSSRETQVSTLVQSNRQLKSQLISAEKYKDLVEAARKRVKNLELQVERHMKEIKKTQEDLNKCKIDVLNAPEHVEHPL